MCNGVLKVFIMITFFSGRPIACEMGVLKVLWFAGKPTACELDVPKVL